MPAAAAAAMLQLQSLLMAARDKGEIVGCVAIEVSVCAGEVRRPLALRSLYHSAASSLGFVLFQHTRRAPPCSS